MTDPITLIASTGAPNLAIDVSPTTGETGTFVLDVSEVDGDALLGWGDNPAGWVNIVCDVTRMSVRRGQTNALGPLTRAEAGTCTVTLLDYERRFDPTVNADAIHPRTPIRVRAWGMATVVIGGVPTPLAWSEVLYTGKINGDGIAVAYSRTGPPVVTLSASDLIGTLARWESVGRAEPGVGAGDDLLTRVLRVLQEVGFEVSTDVGTGELLGSPQLAPDPDPVYAATLAPTVLAKGWDAIALAAEAELGRVWVTAYNSLAVRARGSELTGTVWGTLSDWHGETIDEVGEHCCYVDPLVRYTPEQLVNRVIAARRGGAAPVQLDDATSQAVYEVAATTATSLELADDAQVTTWAGALITGNTEPRVHVDQVTPTPWSAPDAWRDVLRTDIGDRWHFRLHPEQGPTVRQAVGVLGIEHEVTPDGWEITWHTVLAPTPGENPTGWFVLDESELDSGELLAPYPTPLGSFD